MPRALSFRKPFSKRLMLSKQMKVQLLMILADDIGKGDVTTALVKPKRCKAEIVAREQTVVCGLEEAQFLFRHYNVRAKPMASDGAAVKKGEVVMHLEGLNKNILQVERTALNVIAIMSGVADICNKAAKIGRKYGVKIALTRKTMPGFNLFDKKAAVTVGVLPHRLNLSSGILIKDNHLKFFRSVAEAVIRAKVAKKGKVEIEVTTPRQALEAALAKADVIMLDNMRLNPAKKAVKLIRENSKVKVEISGGINFKNLSAYCKLKPDWISMGLLTQKAEGKNFSLEIL